MLFIGFAVFFNGLLSCLCEIDAYFLVFFSLTSLIVLFLSLSFPMLIGFVFGWIFSFLTYRKPFDPDLAKDLSLLVSRSRDFNLPWVSAELLELFSDALVDFMLGLLPYGG